MKALFSAQFKENKMFCWHKWNRWEEYEVEGTPKTNMELVYLSLLFDKVNDPPVYLTRWQKRQCTKCGKTQREQV